MRHNNIEEITDIISDMVINDLSKMELWKSKIFKSFSHFGICLYIRNNYIYNNSLLKDVFEADELSNYIFEKILKKTSWKSKIINKLKNKKMVKCL
ncbi:MAG: hypothetical protein NC483_02455 [Ruminococcus sp.]|nr:hypothetical protein [Ruminococcus sp.]